MFEIPLEYFFNEKLVRLKKKSNFQNGWNPISIVASKTKRYSELPLSNWPGEVLDG